jgi:hypothetical protein
MDKTSAQIVHLAERFGKLDLTSNTSKTNNLEANGAANVAARRGGGGDPRELPLASFVPTHTLSDAHGLFLEATTTIN